MRLLTPYWSFAFNGLATLILRYKVKEEREWKVPGNFRIAGHEAPLGLGAIAASLFVIAILNLFTKEIATISGLAFTVIFYMVFAVSERINQRKADRSIRSLDQFRLALEPDVTLEAVHARPGNVLVPVRDYNTLSHLGDVLDHVDTDEQDVVVLTVRLITGPDARERNLVESALFAEYEQRLFTRVVALAEKHGKPVELLVVPSNNVNDAVAVTALKLDSGEIVTGRSAKMTAQEQAREMGASWEHLAEQPRRQVQFRILDTDGTERSFELGAHAPTLTREDVALIHRLWVQVSRTPSRRRIHHRDVVRVALNRLERDLKGRSDAMLDFYKLEHEDSRTDGSRHPDAAPKRPG